MTIQREKKTITKIVIVWLMGIFILIPGSLGFGNKLYQFIKVLESNDEGGRFAIVPIATYILVSIGFFFVLVWGTLKGMLSDVEGPKYKMLEDEERLDALDKGVSR